MIPRGSDAVSVVSPFKLVFVVARRLCAGVDRGAGDEGEGPKEQRGNAVIL